MRDGGSRVAAPNCGRGREPDGWSANHRLCPPADDLGTLVKKSAKERNEARDVVWPSLEVRHEEHGPSHARQGSGAVWDVLGLRGCNGLRVQLPHAGEEGKLQRLVGERVTRATQPV